MTSQKHQQLVAEITSVHASMKKLVVVLISATQKCKEEESHTNPSEKKLGKLRMEICTSERKVAELQKLRCQWAAEELTNRYLAIEQALEEGRVAQDGMALQQSFVSGQVARIGEKITAFDCDPTWQLSRLAQRVKRMVVGPLRRALEVKLAAQQQGHQGAVDQAAELESQLERIRLELSYSVSQEAGNREELEDVLAQGETCHRVVQGGLQQIRAELSNPFVTLDRWSAEKLLQQWERGFTEVLDRSLSLESDQVVNFAVEEAVIAYWFDTGEVAGSEIMWAAAGDTIWSKSHRGLSLNLTRESLEQKRRAQEAQTLGV